MPRQAHIGKTLSRILLGFIVLAVLLGGFILYFTLSKVEIYVKPHAQKLESDFIADLALNEQAAVSGNEIQGQTDEWEIEGSDSYSATGLKQTEDNIVGTVTIYNNYSQNQPLVATTRLWTEDKIQFRISQRVDVPAGGSVEVSIYPDDDDFIEQIPPGRFTIPGLWQGLQDKIYAESESTIKKSEGGIKFVQEVDIEKAESSIQAKLTEEARQKLIERSQQADTLTILGKQKVLETSCDAEPGDEKDEFSCSAKIKATFVSVDKDKIFQAAQEKIKLGVNQNYELKSIDEESFTYSIESFDQEAGTANLKVHLEGDAVITSEHEILDKERLVGLNQRGLELYLTSFDEVDSVQVNFSPFWVNKVPKMDDHVHIFIIE